VHETVTLGAIVMPLADVVVGKARRGLLLLLASIAGVLLIACANVANLSLTRTVSRLREAAIRSALGAGRARLVASAVAEQLILSTIGGASGLAVAWTILVYVRATLTDLPRVREVALDGRVLLFTLAVSLSAGLLVAILPAWRLAGRGVEGALRATGSALTADRGGMRTRASLLGLQIALSVMLLVVTTLLCVSFMRVLNVDRGFASCFWAASQGLATNPAAALREE
jgi:putative ABC transport system permease protein